MFKADGHFERPTGGEISQVAKHEHEQSSVAVNLVNSHKAIGN
jgi:hypothetical protein